MVHMQLVKPADWSSDMGVRAHREVELLAVRVHRVVAQLTAPTSWPSDDRRFSNCLHFFASL